MVLYNFEDVESIFVDDVVDIVLVDDMGKIALVLRSGGEIMGLVFTSRMAREAASLLLRGANRQ